MSAVLDRPDPDLERARAVDRERAQLEQPGPGGAPAAAPTAPAPEASVDWKAEAHEFTELVFPFTLFRLWPRLKSVWTPEELERLEVRLATVLQKHNLSSARILGKWGPEIMLAVAIGPALVPSVEAIRADIAEKREAKKPAAPAPSPAAAAPAAPAPASSPAEANAAAAPLDTLQLHKQA